jgi:hypothetical protein
MNEKRQIFIGGWGHTGSRLIVRILAKKGYDIFPEECNETNDYLGTDFLPLFKDIYDGKDPGILLDMIEKTTRNSDRWVIKHGHLIMMIPYLKKRFPDSIFIVTIRHPIDSLIHPDPNYQYIGGLETNPPFEKKFEFYKNWYEGGLKLCDYVIKLEDLVLDKHNTTQKLLAFLGHDDDTTMVDSIINGPSPNVGRWRFEAEYLRFPYIIEFIKKLKYPVH